MGMLDTGATFVPTPLQWWPHVTGKLKNAQCAAGQTFPSKQTVSYAKLYWVYLAKQV